MEAEAASSPQTTRPPNPRLLAGALLAVFVLQAAIAAVRDSVTIDEFVGLPVGLYTLRTGDVSTPSMNPPFFRVLATLPLARGPAFDPDPAAHHWAMGTRFMLENAAGYHALYVPVRCMVILAATLLGGLVFVWARALYGEWSAVVAVALFAFAPSFLAHGHLVTLDVAGALTFTLTLFLTWRLLDRPGVGRALALGVSLGLAPLFKLSGVVLAPIVVGLVAVRAVREPERPGVAAWTGWVGLVAATAVVVVNLAYGLDRTLAPLATIGLEPTGTLVALAKAAPELRLPLPAPFLQSLDLILTGDRPGEPTYFLAGELSADGWWYYHLVAFALKTPLPLSLAAVVAAAAWATGRSTGRREYALFLPVAFVFVANSLSNPLNIGVRHALGVEPLLFVAVAPLLAGAFTRAPARPFARIAAAAMLLWYVAGTLAVAPRYLQYFNEVAGGPKGGHRWLVDSNVDWGQDLVRLREYLDERGLRSVNLAYFGRVNPAVYGIDFGPVTPASRGPTVVAATLLMGRPYWVWQHAGKVEWMPAGSYAWLQANEPVARVGALFVYDLP